jgi:hypothetical protein
MVFKGRYLLALHEKSGGGRGEDKYRQVLY